MSSIVLDLTKLPSGRRYEDTYGSWLEIFKMVAEESPLGVIQIIDCPPIWAPLLGYLGASVVSLRNHFEDDYLLEYLFVGCLSVDEINERLQRMSRTSIESFACLRPETVDALWKADVEWDTKLSLKHQAHRPEKSFPVTCNGSFYRKEILKYIEICSNTKPRKKKVVLVPCAADKPYPSELHKKVLEILPDDYYLAIATGVLGIVPMSEWGHMPLYDSGVPNEWRLMNLASDYFSRYRHESIICFTDYYNLALSKALSGLCQSDCSVRFINPVKFYYNYLDLIGSIPTLQKILEEENE